LRAPCQPEQHENQGPQGSLWCVRCSRPVKIGEMITHHSVCVGSEVGAIMRSNELSRAARGQNAEGTASPQETRSAGAPMAATPTAGGDARSASGGAGRGRRPSPQPASPKSSRPPPIETSTFCPWKPRHEPQPPSPGARSPKTPRRPSTPGTSRAGAHHAAGAAHPGKKDEDRSGTSARAHNEAEEVLDELLRTHELAWERLERTTPSCMVPSDIPWPDLGPSKPNALLTHCMQRAARSGTTKSALRKLQVRWHPDKWSQRYASRLHPTHADAVLSRVKEIAQIINGLKVF